MGVVTNVALDAPTSVVVLGMHRSGTSLLTGSLEAAGLYLGNVVNAAPYNLKGNKENEAIRDLNDALLAQQGTAWNTPPNSQLPWDRSARAQARALIQPYLNGGRPWGFKDPRTIWTVGGWMQVLPAPRLIGVFRHPSLVVRSLVARGGALAVTETEATMLWCSYNRELIDLRRRYGFPLLHFESRQSFNDCFLPRLTDFARAIGLSGMPHGFFDETLVHQTELDPITADVRRIYDTLTEMAQD